MDTLSPELQTAIDASKLAAEHALKYFKTDLHVELKDDNTPVTIADRESEQIIRARILQSFPDAKFIGEEGGGNLEEATCWIIDPIDGTKNFTRGLPLWGILIAYFKEGQGIIGVSHVPMMKELLYAEKGKGAYLNDQRVHVSKTDSLQNAFISFGSIKFFENIQALQNLVMQSGGRGIGDAYSYHLLASGRIDAMLEGKTSVWDIAPFRVIIQEAGGNITNLQGESWTVHDKTIIATNGLLHDAFVRIVNERR